MGVSLNGKEGRIFQEGKTKCAKAIGGKELDVITETEEGLE